MHPCYRFLRQLAGIVLPLILFVVACNPLSNPRLAPSSASESSPPPVVFDFAGVGSKADVLNVDGLRATITWTVPPLLVRGYSVSTWIAFAAPAEGGGVSSRIAQVGWIEIDPGNPRLFWEWGTSNSDSHRQLGRMVQPGLPLNVEIDWDKNGVFTFYADNVSLGTASISWSPTEVGAFAETHLTTEYLPGSETQPEVISGFEERVGGTWIRYSGQVQATNASFRVDVSADQSVRIWDVRQSSK